MKELNVGIVACASMQEQVKECLGALESSFRIYPIVPSCTFSVNIDLFRHYLNRSTSENDVTLLAYGICHPQILTLLAEYGDRVVKVEGSNCFEMFLGSEKYSEYHRKCYWMLNKPFFTRWRNEILTGFGAGTSNGRTLIGDAFKKLVYLGFENDELSVDLVEDFARAVGLEYEIYSADTANFKRLLEEALASAYPTARVKVPKPSVSYPHQSEMRTLVESIGEVIYKVDVNTKQFTFISPQVKTILGYTPSELLGIVNDHPRTPFYHEDDRQKVVAGRYKFLVKCLSEGMQKPYEAEYRVRHKNGDIIWVKECIYPSYSSDGVIESFVGKIADITERKRMEHDLNERVKELNCLYGIAQTAESPDITLDELYQETTNLLPAGWQYPEITCARITINGNKFETENYQDTQWKQSSDIMIYGNKVGIVEVCYLEERPHIYEGPFLKEERVLIDAVAMHIGHITERKRAEEALRQAHSELERRVEERTAELVKANKALRIEMTERKQAEEELRKFKTISDRAAYGAGIITPDGILTYVNESFAAMHGYTIEELIGKDLSIFHTEEQMKLVERLRKQLREKGSYVAEEVWHKTKDGTVFPTLMTGTAIIDDKGKPLYLCATAIDITERKQAEEALQESERKYRYLFEELNDAAFLADVETGHVLDTNKQGEVLMGRTREDIIGMHQSEFHPPGKAKEYRQRFADHIKKGRAVDYDGEVINKDGSIVPVHISATPITIGGKQLIIGLFCDITERKQMEEELRESQQNFRNSLDSSPLGIRIITADGELLYANQAILDIYGYSCIEELKAIPAKQRYTAESYAEHQERKEKRKLGKPVPSNYEISIVRKDGEIRRLVVFREEVVWGGEVQFQALYQDITERKRVEIALRESEEFSSSLFINSPNPILVLSDDTSIRYVNPALEKLTGFTRAELIGKKPPYPWWREGTYKKYHRNLAIAMRRRRGKCEQLFRTKNGQQFWVEVTFETVELNGEFKYNLSNWVDFTERKRLRENMEFYISQITRAQEEERKRIAREIHDEWVQSLAVLALHMDAMAADTGKLPEDIIERIRGFRAETNTILEGLRRFSHELRPGVIDQIGLVPALEILTEELNKEIWISARLEVTGPERRLTAEIELVLFRIAQEALRNVRRHSQATKAVIRLKFTRRKIKLAVSDNGRGFEVPEMLGDLAAEGKLGLIGIQERARLLDGKLAVKSRAGRGTRVILEVET